MTLPRPSTAAIVSAVINLGVASVIALGFAWFLASDVKADLRDVKAAIGSHAVDTRDTLRLLKAICLNVSKSDVERANCEVG